MKFEVTEFVSDRESLADKRVSVVDDNDWASCRRSYEHPGHGGLERLVGDIGAESFGELLDVNGRTFY